MKISDKYALVAQVLKTLYPDTHTFLHYSKDYEFLFAIILSAQATDDSVNQATSRLFKEFPSLNDYKVENKDRIYSIIKNVGLGKSKSEYLIKTADILLKEYQGRVPKNREELMKLYGVGYKTSGVLLAELYDFPYIPVDTHILRVSHRIGLVKDDLDATATEKALEKGFKNFHKIEIHRQLILFGRNICKALKPRCMDCPFKEICKYHIKNGR